MIVKNYDILTDMQGSEENISSYLIISRQILVPKHLYHAKNSTAI